MVRANDAGWEYECDQRHVEIILEHLRLTEAKPLGTPGVEDTTAKNSEDDAEIPLSAPEASLYRAVVARANYISQDRPDLQYAVKELCRRISDPREASMMKLKRLGRYLKGQPRVVSLFPWQESQQCIDVYTDANWAGCRASRKSTSGGAILLG